MTAGISSARSYADLEPLGVPDYQEPGRVWACNRHLADLKRVHKRPPPDVKVRPGRPRRVTAPATVGSIGSPAGMCEEIA
jgi:hypothetical protein